MPSYRREPLIEFRWAVKRSIEGEWRKLQYRLGHDGVYGEIEWGEWKTVPAVEVKQFDI